MRSLGIVLMIVLLSSVTALSQEMPKDVPEDHYAYDAINDLVERGVNVSQGYPDGTFRGNRHTNRYETAYLMASLALSLQKEATTEIDVSDIREELDWLRKEIKSIKEQPEVKKDLMFFGSVGMKSEFGSVIAYDPKQRGHLGPETNYRLKYTMEKALGNDANLKINLDTMDGGFNSSTQRYFPIKLIDIEGNFMADLGFEDPVKVRAIMGPGTVYHRDTSGVAPSEDNMVYSRPKPSLILSTVIGGNDVALGYVARGVTANGQVGTSEINLAVGEKFGSLSFLGSLEATSTARFVFSDFMDPPGGPYDLRGEVLLSLMQKPGITEKVIFGTSKSDLPGHNYYFNLGVYLKSFGDPGTDVNFMFHSVGDGYRYPFEELEFVSSNLFDKKIHDGTVDLGLEIVRTVSDDFIIKSRSDWVGNSRWKMGKDIPGSSFTQELSFDYLIRSDFILSTFYRYYYVPSKQDLFYVSVPEASDIIGLGLTYKF